MRTNAAEKSGKHAATTLTRQEKVAARKPGGGAKGSGVCTAHTLLDSFVAAFGAGVCLSQSASTRTHTRARAHTVSCG